MQEPLFPPPTYFGKNRHWKLSELLEYEAQLNNEPFSKPPESEEQYLTAAQVRKRYGGVSDMWLWRRLNPDRSANRQAA